MLRVAIVEDSKQDMNILKEHLAHYSRDTSQAVKVEEFSQAETFLQNYRAVYDVVFMDIGLPFMDGMSAAEALRKVDTEVAIIFATDMQQYALRGYKVNALDYFVKPVKYYDVKLRLNRVTMLKEASLPTIVIHIPNSGDLAMSSRDIYYIDVMNKSLTYHTTRGNYTIRSVGLKELEKDLNECGFCRCSSSYLVNLDWCQALSDDAVIVAGDTLRISRGMRQKFVTELSKSFSRMRFSKKGVQYDSEYGQDTWDTELCFGGAHGNDGGGA